MSPFFDVTEKLQAHGREYRYYNLKKLEKKYPESNKLPYSLKILLENLLRHQDDAGVTRTQIEALAAWDPQAKPATEIAFTPARVILQDFTGVPAIVDLAAMRDAMNAMGGNPKKINPLSPAELVIDHSVQVDVYGSPNAIARNTAIEFQRNRERYAFLRWGQRAFDNFKVVPPSTGIVHQVNIEYLARVVFDQEGIAYPDTLVGTDSHTTMVNGLGVLGWGVGGIEAEAAMLGQPISMLIPQVIGFELTGKLPEGTTATDLVLTVTEMLRAQGLVGKFVEFFGDGLSYLPLADRATLGNMSPEFGSTCAIFPIDAETIRYLELTGRPAEQIALVEAYAKAQGLWREDGAEPAHYSQVLKLDLGRVEPSIAGPKRPQDRISLRGAKEKFAGLLEPLQNDRTAKNGSLDRFENEGGDTAVGVQAAHENRATATVNTGAHTFTLSDGDIVIAAITSCTNTSNPAVMIGAGLLARNANQRGMAVKPWVKTSLAPGSKVVTDYLKQSELMDDLEALGFSLVGYGCTTCIGNSGPLKPEISRAIQTQDLVACAVLSGNRNFEGRIHPEVKMNFLASPPLVVAYALAGSMRVDLFHEPLGQDLDGKDVFLKDLWPSPKEIQEFIAANINPEMFKRSYDDVFQGDELWKTIEVPEGDIYAWPDSTYVKNPPYFIDMKPEPEPIGDLKKARVLAWLGDSVTTDHISPAGAIKKDSPAGQYLIEQGVEAEDFNSYGSRRGNHEVMMRGTFANIRLRNLLAPGTEGGFTVHIPSGEQMSIFDAAMKYQEERTPLIVIAGSEYGSGSSRDWAAKGTLLLGVKAVLAKSYERIHRSNLIGMGVMPLQFKDGEDAQSLGLSGKESYTITGLSGTNGQEATVIAQGQDGEKSFQVRVRLDTPKEREYYRHGGILHYVLRQLAT